MTKEQLRKIAKHATQKTVDVYYPILVKYMQEYGITGRMREAAFIAQIIHESGSFRYTKELASGSAYEGRKDLGNTNTGDGVRFKGRGLIQVTGRSNYEQLTRVFGVDLVANPELLEQPDLATRTACWWWHNRDLNRLADGGHFIQITKKINGGTNGLKDRQEHYELALSVL